MSDQSATQNPDSSSTLVGGCNPPTLQNLYAEESARLYAEEGITDRTEVALRLIKFAEDRGDAAYANELRRGLKKATKRTKAEIQAQAAARRQERENSKWHREAEREAKRQLKLQKLRASLLTEGHEPLDIAQVLELIDRRDYVDVHVDSKCRLLSFEIGERDLLPVVRAGDRLVFQSVSQVKTPLKPHTVAIVASEAASYWFVGWVYISEDAKGVLHVQKHPWRSGFNDPLSNYEVLAICVGQEIHDLNGCIAAHLHESHAEQLITYEDPNPMMWRYARDMKWSGHGKDIGIAEWDGRTDIDRSLVSTLLKFGGTPLGFVVTSLRGMIENGSLSAAESDASVIVAVHNYIAKYWYYSPEYLQGIEVLARKQGYATYEEFSNAAANDNEINVLLLDLENTAERETIHAYGARILDELDEIGLAKLWRADSDLLINWALLIVAGFDRDPTVLHLSDEGPSGLLCAVNMVGQ